MSIVPLPKSLGLQIDGRRQRSAQGRRRVALSMLELIREQGSAPSMDEVAIHAKVSRRSAFRYFEDVPALELAALRLMREEVQKHHPLPHPRGDVHTRMAKVVEHRGDIFAFMSPLLRLAQARREGHPEIHRELVDLRFSQREHLMVVFTEELAALSPDIRDDRLHALEMVCGFDAHHALREGQQCTEAQARRVTLQLMQATLLRSKMR
ncbi:MAG: TetR/AcrR family transcriptional regulator [Deltaproteobacteria bacterium]|nr:TetR/AcrR family transcriptional regulator [Deltaproteobacteria bacterium]